MKAPGFWYRPASLEAAVLYPLTAFWRFGSFVRRLVATPYRAKFPVICIGNMTAGGAGKTPVALAVAQMLIEQGKKPVFVTRGYGGRENGPLLVDQDRHTALDVGDEALLLARVAPVWIGRDRAAAIRGAEKHGTHIILDDGMQNPSILPNLAFLVIDGTVGFGNGLLIPAGPLRETFESAMKRTTAVILIGEDDGKRVTSRLRCPVIHGQWQPQLPADFPRTKKFLAFAGIALPEKFYETCRREGLTLAGTHDFADHHIFTASERAALLKQATSLDAQLLTTEKDKVRLPPNFRDKVLSFPASLVFNEPEVLLAMLDRI